MFVFVLKIPLLKGHLYSEERYTFSGSQNLSLNSIQGTFNTQKVTDNKKGSLDNFRFTLITVMSALTN